MTAQEIFASFYVVVGLALASAPVVYVILRRGAEGPASIRAIPGPAILAIVLLASLIVAAAIVEADGVIFLIGSVILSALVAALTAKEKLKVFLLSFASVGASGTLLWWKYDNSHEMTVQGVYLICFFIVIAIIALPTFIRNFRYRKIDVAVIIVLLLFVVQHSTNMSVLLDDGVYTAIRHHWGAYIGPSETVLSGARILYDIPAQYGLGPTLLIASACGNNCWIGMYWITTLASVIYALIVVCSASIILRRVDNSWAYGATLLAAAAACMLWTSYPPQLGGPWSFPSTGGLRFIPLAAMLLFILWSESRPTAGRPSRVYGYLLWCVGAVWAPESAFYLSLVWWPYRLWRASASSVRPLRAAVLAVVELAAVAAALIIVFIAGFYAIYGLIPSLDVYVAYVVNPTGPQPPNPLGSVWFFVFTMIAGVSAAALSARKNTDSTAFASLFVCILALFAVFSYYIGRSHDNNILNIMPFLVLVLAAVQGFAPVPALTRSAGVAIAATLASVMFFNWSAWRQTSLSDYASSAPAASMSYIRGQTAEQTGAAAISPSDGQPGQRQESEKSRLDGANPADAARAVFYVSSVRGEPLIKIDDGLDMAPIGPRAWSAIHDPIDFYFLPDGLVAKLINRTMHRINSPGWLVIAKHVDEVAETLRWQRLLEASYTKTEEMDFGAYRAIRYVPNPQ